MDKSYNLIPANFKKGTITVFIEDPGGKAVKGTKWYLNPEEVPSAADIVRVMNCVFLGIGDCGEGVTPKDVVVLLKRAYEAGATLEAGSLTSQGN